MSRQRAQKNPARNHTASRAAPPVEQPPEDVDRLTPTHHGNRIPAHLGSVMNP